MKILITALALMLSLISCRSFVGSVTTIPPGKEFELGNNQHRTFTAQVHNTGAVLVTVSQRQANGPVTPLGQLKPGAHQTVQISADATAIFKNASAKAAELSLRLTGDTNLRMGYATN